jgi:2-iminobutanoate/2-iminopropanoate deaminase
VAQSGHTFVLDLLCQRPQRRFRGLRKRGERISDDRSRAIIIRQASRENIRMEKRFHVGTWQEGRAFSPAVETRGGRMIWVAGHGGLHEADKPLDGDFDGQTRQAFRNIGNTLARAGGKLTDIVTMTVFIADSRYGDRFIEIRKEIFPSGQYPASALITAAGFARPAMLVEIQCVAVLPE